MRPFLAIGLGNPLMGDDGVGACVAQTLAADPALAPRLDVVCGGTDLLPYAEQMVGRKRVLLVDACQGGETGALSVVDEPSDSGSDSAHALSAVRTLDLLRRVSPELRAVRFTWVLIHIHAAELRPDLSPQIEAAASRAAEAVRKLVV